MPLFHSPDTAVFALIVGLLGILFEFHAPGSIFPGVAGFALALLAAASLSQYPLSPGAITLIAIAALFLILELKIRSQGILSATGAVLLACGIYLLIDSGDPTQHIRPITALGVVLPFGLLTAFLLTVASRARHNKLAAGPTTLVGQIGTVIAAPDSLRIQVAGEYWNAVSHVPLVPGTSVRVIDIQGLELSVVPLPKDEPDAITMR